MHGSAMWTYTDKGASVKQLRYGLGYPELGNQNYFQVKIHKFHSEFTSAVVLCVPIINLLKLLNKKSLNTLRLPLIL